MYINFNYNKPRRTIHTFITLKCIIAIKFVFNLKSILFDGYSFLLMPEFFSNFKWLILCIFLV